MGALVGEHWGSSDFPLGNAEVTSIPESPFNHVPTSIVIWYFLSSDVHKTVVPAFLPWGPGATVVVVDVVVVCGIVGGEVARGFLAVVAGVGRVLTVGDGVGPKVVVGAGALLVVAAIVLVVVEIIALDSLVVASTAAP